MNDAIDREKWNRRYTSAAHDAVQIPARVLLDYQHLLPHHGLVLDLACGLGANALLLAQLGLSVMAWDISDRAIARLQQSIAACKLESHIKTEVRDVLQAPPAANTFDVIVVSRFLERTLFPMLIQSLRPGGLLFYQTYSKDKPDSSGPNNPAYLLNENELLDLCRGMRILAYREEGQLGDCARGWRNEAMIVAQRRP